MDYVAEAMYYMAELKIDGWNVASINCSFGTSNSGGISSACTYLQAQDVVVCVSAGNSNSTSPSYLGSRGDCLDVGATNSSGNPASFSNYGTWVDIAAPGVEVMSTITDPADPEGDYVAYMDGTSMSSPHVAGVVALLESYKPSLSATEKMDIITDPANVKSYNMTKNVGVGIVDARKCLDAAGGGCDLAADFSGTPTSGCAALTVNFTDLSTGTGIDGWSWDFGDGVGTSTQQNPLYTYNNPGTYSVSLTVSSSSQSCNDAVTKTGYITVNGGPTADFVGSPTSGIEPLTVDFTDQSTDATGWSWDFGDGVGTSTEQNPSYTYTSEGTYTVTLTASNACGTDVNEKIDYITVDPCVAPVADFVGSPTSGTAPLTVDFTDLSTNGTSWSWDFGDGVGTSTQQNPTYTYTSAGTYTVELTVTNSCGSDIATKVDYISVTEPEVGMAYANADIPILGTVTGSYANTNTSDDTYEVLTEEESSDHPRKTTSRAEHKWTFNVASTGTTTFYVEAYRTDNTDGDDFTFAYSTDDATYVDLVTVASAAEQTYSASLPNGLTGTVYIRVIDTNRSWDNISLDQLFVDYMYIEYETTPQVPVADFSGSPTSGSVPLTVNFTDLSTGTPDTWSWDFGDGVGTSTEQNPTYTYTSTGTYNVSLTVSNAQGSDNETKVGYITVTEAGSDMYVYSIVVTRKVAGPNESGKCNVIIYDDSNAPLANATVYVTATGPVGGDYNALTDANGVASFETGKTKNPSGEWCFEVTNVTHATYTYNPSLNNVTKACESGTVYKLSNISMIPAKFDVGNAPNPFNPVTELFFSLPEAAHVRLDVYNIIGQKVVTLTNRYYPAGNHSLIWDATDQASGMYFYRFSAGEFLAKKKMLLLK
jgi:PKD repeat protein